jgi:hypothetical protein
MGAELLNSDAHTIPFSRVTGQLRCAVSYAFVAHHRRRLKKIGFGIRLHSSNPQPLMSALGQERTLRHLRLMSAISPQAEITEGNRHVRFVPLTSDLRLEHSSKVCFAIR